jgi:hypothetical protein
MTHSEWFRFAREPIALGCSIRFYASCYTFFKLKIRGEDEQDVSTREKLHFILQWDKCDVYRRRNMEVLFYRDARMSDQRPCRDSCAGERCLSTWKLRKIVSRSVSSRCRCLPVKCDR